MTIRLEQPKDYREVENLTREAFWNVYRPGCLEHYVLNQYRNNPDFIPELDFVMEENDKIIGHIMFSKAELILDDGTKKPSWTFGPISRQQIQDPLSRRATRCRSALFPCPRAHSRLASEGRHYRGHLLPAKGLFCGG